MVTPAVTIRRAVPDDAAAVRQIFRRAVLAVDRRHYTPEELADWAACGEQEAKWREKMGQQAFFIAQNIENQPIGFASITPIGYLDLLYVDPRVQGQGVGAELLKTVDNQAKNFGIKDITSEVSLPALSFFVRRGYRVKREQKRVARTLALTSFLITKEL